MWYLSGKCSHLLGHIKVCYKVDTQSPLIRAPWPPARDDAHYWVLPRAQQVRQGHVHWGETSTLLAKSVLMSSICSDRVGKHPPPVPGPVLNIPVDGGLRGDLRLPEYHALQLQSFRQVRQWGSCQIIYPVICNWNYTQGLQRQADEVYQT